MSSSLLSYRQSAGSTTDRAKGASSVNWGIRAALWALVAIFVINGPVEAQQNLVVRPMRVEAEIPPNRTAQVMLTIRNQ
jgi:hypothetical protein